MKKLDELFDNFFKAVCKNTPVLGSPLLKYYLKHERFQKFAKFGVSTLLVYWVVRAPLLWGLTELTSMHYVVSAFFVGLILTVIGFFLNDLWIWKETLGGGQSGGQTQETSS